MYWKRFLICLVVFSSVFSLFAGFPSKVNAGCYPNATCLGTTVVGVEGGCRNVPPNTPVQYHNQLWSNWPITCDGNCAYNFTVTGYVCCNYGPNTKPYYCSKSHSGSCCSACTPSWGGCSRACGPGTRSDGCGHTQACNNGPCSSCTLSLAPAPTTVTMGGTQLLTATVTPQGDTVSSVAFVSGTPAVAAVSPASDTTSPYTTTATGVSTGISTVTATATLSLGGTCSNTSTITVPACTVTLTPNPYTFDVGYNWPFTATLVNITPASVSFTSSNTGAVTVSPASSTTSPYITTGTAVSTGTSILTASAILGGVSRCSGNSNVTVNNNVAWWQVKDADVSTNGDLYSAVP